MRLASMLASLVVLASGCGPRPPSGATAGPAEVPALRWHFVGTEALRENTNASRLRAVLAEPATRTLQENLLGRLAAVPARYGAADPSAALPDTARLVRPILDDLLRVESLGEYRATTNHPPQVTLAARLGTERRQLWQTNWEALVTTLGAGPPTNVQVGPLSARTAPLGRGPQVSWFAQSGEWTLLGWGQGPTSGLVDLARRAGAMAANAATGSTAWLEVALDLPQLARTRDWPAPASWPKAEVKVTGRGSNVRATGRLEFAAPIDLKLEPWRIPTNTITDPLVSFTAVQGLGPRLRTLLPLEPVNVPSLPNQVYGWALGEVPFQTYFAWEWPDRTNALRQLAPQIPSLISNVAPRLSLGQVGLESNPPRIVWAGIPMAEPFLGAATADAGFVIGGLFPIVRPNVPGPAELYSLILGRTNLVYYDWELTQKRLEDWWQMRLLYWMVAGYASPSTNSPVLQWWADTNVVQHFGNTVTEITLASPRELSLVRNGSVGLTGFELNLLLRWFDDPAFPGWSEPAPNPGLRRPAAPAPVAPADSPAPTNAPAPATQGSASATPEPRTPG